MRLTDFTLRLNDVGSEIPLNLTHNNVDISPGVVDVATLLVQHENGVHGMELSPPGGSTNFPDQWTYAMTQEDFDILGVGTFYSEIKVELNGGQGVRTIPTEKSLTLKIQRVLGDPDTTSPAP